MGDTRSDEVIDGTKLSILGLLARVSIPQLFFSVSVVFGVGFGAAKLHTAYVEKRDADAATEQIRTARGESQRLDAEIKECRGTLETAQTELGKLSRAAAPTTKGGDCPGLDSYYVNTTIGQFNAAQCFADTMTAASKMGFSATRVEHEVKLNGPVGGANHFCSVFCGQQVIVVSCNGQSNSANIGLTTRIKEQLVR